MDNNNGFERMMVRVLAAEGRLSYHELLTKLVEVGGPEAGLWLEAEYKEILVPKPRYRHAVLSNGTVVSEEI